MVLLNTLEQMLTSSGHPASSSLQTALQTRSGLVVEPEVSGQPVGDCVADSYGKDEHLQASALSTPYVRGMSPSFVLPEYM